MNERLFSNFIDGCQRAGLRWDAVAARLEREWITRLMARTNHGHRRANRSNVARLMGMHRNTLLRKLQQAGVPNAIPPRAHPSKAACGVTSGLQGADRHPGGPPVSPSGIVWTSPQPGKPERLAASR